MTCSCASSCGVLQRPDRSAPRCSDILDEATEHGVIESEGRSETFVLEVRVALPAEDRRLVRPTRSIARLPSPTPSPPIHESREIREDESKMSLSRARDDATYIERITDAVLGDRAVAGLEHVVGVALNTHAVQAVRRALVVAVVVAREATDRV